MNVELAKQVRELIRQHPEQHDQYIWSNDYYKNPVTDCGTRACIAGWTAAALGLTVAEAEDEERANDSYGGIAIWAERKLEISEDQANVLFDGVSNERALEVLDRLIETEGDADYEDLHEIAYSED